MIRVNFHPGWSAYAEGMDPFENLALTAETLALIHRYQGSTPRYTSYPTADRFHSGFTSVEFLKHVRASNRPQIPAPLSFYIHVPFCHSLCYYCGCNKMVTQGGERAQPFIRSLISEFDQLRDCIDPDREVEQIHFGGGTPNWLNPRQISQIMTALGGDITYLPGQGGAGFRVSLPAAAITPAA